MNDDQAITTTGFGTDSMEVVRDVSTHAMAERAKAQITARYIMAMQRPRSLDTVRQKLLKECDRPQFAASARYIIPRGGGNIEGPTIRFAEAAIRCMTNLAVEQSVISDDAKRTVLHISVTDLESNIAYETEVSITKTVERKQLKRGQRSISERVNSYGNPVYIVEATDDEVLMKTNSLVSKAIRTLGLRHLPGDILEEAMDKCIATAAQRDARDPDAARKALLDAFMSIGVDAAQVSLYLGHSPDVLDPAELAELRAVYGGVKDGELTWRSAIEAKTGEVTGDADGEQATAQQQKAQDIIAKRKADAKTKAAKGKQKPAAAAKSSPDEAAAPPAEERGREPGED